MTLSGCINCGDPATKLGYLCPQCIAQYVAAAKQAAQQIHDCPYCSAVSVHVPMQHDPDKYTCTVCGHIEYKLGVVTHGGCQCGNCYFQNIKAAQQNAANRTATGVAAQYPITGVAAQYQQTWPKRQASNMTPQPINIRIWWDPTVQAYRMTSAFNRELVDALKAFIPVSDRSYDPATKIWTFVEKTLAPLQGLIAKLGFNATIMTRQQVETSQQASSAAPAVRGRPLDAVIIEFVRILPYEAAKAAFRRAALELHPDRNNGDSSKMTTLNADWDRIAKEVYGQQ